MRRRGHAIAAQEVNFDAKAHCQTSEPPSRPAHRQRDHLDWEFHARCAGCAQHAAPPLRSDFLIHLQGSQIDDDVPSRSRAANEKVAVGGLLERLRFIGDGARNQTAFTVVTNTGPA